MVAKEITFTDFDGQIRTKKFWFNLTQAEVQELNVDIPGGLESVIKDIHTDPNVPKIFEAFKKIIKKAYGVRTADKKFYKDEIETKSFIASDAYSKLFMGMMTATEDDTMAFVEGMFPAGSIDTTKKKDLIDKVKEAKDE